MKKVANAVGIAVAAAAVALSLAFIAFTIKTEGDEAALYTSLKERAVIQVESNNESGLVSSKTVSKKEAPSSLETPMGEPEAHSEINWALLKSENPSVSAWLAVPDAGISTPVLFDSSGFYVDHDFWGNESKFGAVFSDAPVSSSAPVSIFYGHNMRSGEMFGNLKRLYKSGSIGQQVVAIYPDGTAFNGRVFAMAVVDKESDLYSAEGDAQSYASRAAGREVSASRAVVLSTCYGYRGTSRRLLVFACE